MATTEQLLLQELKLPVFLGDRILCRVPPSASAVNGGNNNFNGQQQRSKDGDASFVLYLPTVLLRKRHNPSFAFACRLANHCKVPLLVLVTVLDDKHLTSHSRSKISPPIVMTSRRLAFTLEALQESCCKEWESHGAGVAVRVHGPGSRTPHHLSLAHLAAAVVSDEPFVEPYRAYARKITKTCLAASVPFWTVDGSTSVPPRSKLKRVKQPPSTATASMEGDVWFEGAPSKAWRWEKQTESLRKQHVYGAHRERALDAPDIRYRLPPDFFLPRPPSRKEPDEEAVSRNNTDDGVVAIDGASFDGDDDNNGNFNCNGSNTNTKTNSDSPWLERILDFVPTKWKSKEASAPGQRPWSVTELCAIQDCKAWAMAWEGADPSVRPCKQTHGSRTAAKRRWRSFVESGGLKNYAKQRNKITNPHAVSRVSAYLNLGILSIFDVLHDVWEAKSQRGHATGCNKFLDEVVKWREGSYVHAFANPNYHTAAVLPPWARRHLESARKISDGTMSAQNNIDGGYDYLQLETASTRDETWNAMQDYLVDTGELHNNARMTWGKTVVHWQALRFPHDEVLWHLCCLNDRFALDGLSPPSYGGVLWCFGWQDKPAPGSKVSEKWAHRYRTGPSGFSQAKELLLLHECELGCKDQSETTNESHATRKRTTTTIIRDNTSCSSPSAKKFCRNHKNATTMSKDSKSILSYFSPAFTSTQREIG